MSPHWLSLLHAHAATSAVAVPSPRLAAEQCAARIPLQTEEARLLPPMPRRTLHLFLLPLLAVLAYPHQCQQLHPPIPEPTKFRSCTTTSVRYPTISTSRSYQPTRHCSHPTSSPSQNMAGPVWPQYRHSWLRLHSRRDRTVSANGGASFGGVAIYSSANGS